MISIPLLIFRPATDGDDPAIIDIHNANVRGQPDTAQRGFLLAPIDSGHLQEQRQQGVHYYVAGEDGNGGGVVGFLSVSMPEVNEAFVRQLTWTHEAYPQRLLSQQNVYIRTVATRGDRTGQGVAQFMYQSLYELYPDAVFTAFVVSKPIRNDRSITFHEKQGFKAVGILQRDEFLDLKPYESLLMARC